MSVHRDVVLAFSQAKSAAIFFDHVVPLLGVLDVLREGLLGNDYIPFDELIISLCPPQIDTSGLIKDIHLIYELANKNHIEAVKQCKDFIKKYSLILCPIFGDMSLFSFKNIEYKYVGLQLANLSLIDCEKTPWKQIIEFRKDRDACVKLKRLKSFFFSNYQNKDSEYIYDDISQRIQDYNDVIKHWGFETRIGVLEMIVNSKTFIGFSSLSFFSTLFGADSVALGSLLSGVSLEISKVLIHIAKTRFKLKEEYSKHPAAYITYARDKLLKK